MEGKKVKLMDFQSKLIIKYVVRSSWMQAEPNSIALKNCSENMVVIFANSDPKDRYGLSKYFIFLRKYAKHSRPPCNQPQR